VTHWINVLAVLIMLTRRPGRSTTLRRFFAFSFSERDQRLAGGLQAPLQWHFAAMWLLALNGLIYVLYGVFSGHFRREVATHIPARRVAPRWWHRPLRGKLAHEDLSVYNAAQTRPRMSRWFSC